MAIKAEEPETIAPSLLLPQTPSPKKRTKPTKDDDGSPKKKALPSSLEEVSEKDKMLLRMKDEENATWPEIREAWENMTGTKVGRSTLGIRYTRLKASLAVWDEADIARLLEAGKAVEAEFEREKYGRIAKALVEAGGKSYDTTAVQRKYKELTK
ncbi:hypothetical protein KEM56_007701 [Ascosphaera pollenicola]|nr:hypothetical protein KEM56_007701 [Ascosphaera pollenicola]